MTALIKNFVKSESGAVTVDWVVLTAAIVGLGLAVMAVISGGLQDVAGDINNVLTNNNMITTQFTAPSSPSPTP
jgi:Flp pilus assembly pilin Flp